MHSRLLHRSLDQIYWVAVLVDNTFMSKSSIYITKHELALGGKQKKEKEGVKEEKNTKKKGEGKKIVSEINETLAR